jgi:prevent-host-death family protein
MAQQISIHEAKTHLSQLLQRVEQGESFVNAQAGRPVARLIPWETTQPQRRLGLLDGQLQIPEDFNTALAKDIEDLFS